MKSSELELRYWAALGVVREAGRLAADLYHRRHELAVERKGTQDLVSEADRGCEDRIVGTLGRLFPEDGFLGEERGVQNQGAAATWIIDPIDGTANFLRGIPLWCVSLGLLAGGEFVLGVIYNPVTEELYAALKGGGATLNGKPIKVSQVTSLDEARIGLGFSYRQPIAPHTETIASLLGAKCEYSRLGSGALGLDGFYEGHINAWDVAAGLCIVKEAGGEVNDFLKADGLDKGNAVLAATPRLYASINALVSLPA